MQLLAPLGAIALALAAGFGMGRGVPSWRADLHNDVDLSGLDELPDEQPVDSLYPYSHAAEGLHAYLGASRSAQFTLNLSLLALALCCAWLAWPPRVLDPWRSDPADVLIYLACQRWLWITAGACLAGCIAGGALALLRRDWFR